jgi:hypothetical protein
MQHNVPLVLPWMRSVEHGDRLKVVRRFNRPNMRLR